MLVRFRFTKAQRIRKRRDFERVQTGGTRVHASHFLFLLHAQPASGEEGALARLGIVASKKVGNAVARNRVKRVCRACFRLFPGLVPNGIDLVVIARPGADRLKLDAVMAEWRRAARALEGKSRVLLLARAAQATHVPATSASAAPASNRVT